MPELGRRHGTRFHGLMAERRLERRPFSEWLTNWTVPQINAKIPAKLLNSKSLTLDFSRWRFGWCFLGRTYPNLIIRVSRSLG
jgi:hypothetical protein